MLGKVGKERGGAKGIGKSQFEDLVNYLAREVYQHKPASRCPPFPAVNRPHGRRCRWVVMRGWEKKKGSGQEHPSAGDGVWTSARLWEPFGVRS
jgi:hypothetical protein